MVTYEQVLTARKILETLLAMDRDGKLVFPSAVRIKLAQNRRFIRPLVTEYLDEYNKLIEKYGKKNEKGEFVVSVADREAYGKYKDEHKALLAVNSEVSFNPLTRVELFGDGEKENQIPFDVLDEGSDIGLLKME